MSLLAAATPESFTIWLIFLWGILIPAFAIIPVMFALAQIAGERKQNLEFERGIRPEDPDTVVTDA